MEGICSAYADEGAMEAYLRAAGYERTHIWRLYMR